MAGEGASDWHLLGTVHTALRVHKLICNFTSKVKYDHLIDSLREIIIPTFYRFLHDFYTASTGQTHSDSKKALL